MSFRIVWHSEIMFLTWTTFFLAHDWLEKPYIVSAWLFFLLYSIKSTKRCFVMILCLKHGLPLSVYLKLALNRFFYKTVRKSSYYSSTFSLEHFLTWKYMNFITFLLNRKSLWNWRSYATLQSLVSHETLYFLRLLRLIIC